MSDELIVNMATHADIDGLITIEKARLATGEIESLNVDDVRRRLEGARLDEPRNGFVVIARLNGEPVGAATVTFLLDYPAASERAYVHDLAVVPESRGRGIAKKLLLTIKHLATMRSCHCIETLSEPDNERAKALYAALGYVSVERFKMRCSLK